MRFIYKIGYKKLMLISLIMATLLFSFKIVLATGNLSDAFKVDNKGVYGEKDHLDSAAFNMGYKISLSGPNDATTPETIVSMVIQAVLSLLGVLFIILMIYGGALWMLAGGNDQKIDKAKNILKRATIGLLIVLFAYAISVLLVSIFVSVDDVSVNDVSVDDEPYDPGNYPPYW